MPISFFEQIYFTFEMSLSLGLGTSKDFVLSEFKDLILKDKRLVKRFQNIMVTLQKRAGSCIRKLFLDLKEARQTYDFLGNSKVKSSLIMNEHFKQTAQRIQSSKASYILLIQDRMLLNFTHHLAKTDIGRIGKSGTKKDQYGLFQHSTLCITDTNECLGLINVRVFHNDEFNTEVHPDYRSIEEKNSHIWIESCKKAQSRLPSASRIIHVADRESDIFEFLHALITENQEFVIRAQHNRFTEEGDQKRSEKIWSVLEKEPHRGTLILDMQDAQGTKEVHLLLKAKTVTFPVPRKRTKNRQGELTPLKINVVQVYNDEHEWVLLTSLPIDSPKDIEEAISIYKKRWHIESFHKVLKTGYAVDEIYLHKDRQTIENLLAMASIAACRLYWLIYTGQTEGILPAHQFFEDYEWTSVYVYFNEPLPDECPSLSEILLRIARLGGYKKQGKKQHPPGILTMCRGFHYFSTISNMYKNMIMSRKT